MEVACANAGPQEALLSVALDPDVTPLFDGVASVWAFLQNDGTKTSGGLRPQDLRCATAAKPIGPAPMTATVLFCGIARLGSTSWLEVLAPHDRTCPSSF